MASADEESTKNEVAGDVHGLSVQANTINHAYFHPVSPPPDGAEPFWVTTRGGSGTTPHENVFLTLEGKSHQKVVIHEFAPVVLNRWEEGQTTLIRMESSLPVRWYGVDLDGSPPTVAPMRECDVDPRGASARAASRAVRTLVRVLRRPVELHRGNTVAEDFPFAISSTDPEVFRLSPDNRGTVDWELDISWSHAGRTGTTRVNRNGDPFRSTSLRIVPGTNRIG